MAGEQTIIGPGDVVLVTGAAGFIGARVVERLAWHGVRTIRCLVRPSTSGPKLAFLQNLELNTSVEIVRGNLLSREDCMAITQDADVVIHLAAGRGEKSFPDAFMNSAVTTRNLLDACALRGRCKRFVNMSSFAVYDNKRKPGRLLDETCPLEQHPEIRGEAYCFAKTKQDEIVAQYRERYKLPVVTLRPGVVYGPGNLAITGRVGIGTFGVFLHLGGSNRIPLTFVDNCAEAIVLAAIRRDIESETFNVVDDELPSSRTFLRLYKRNVRSFKSIYVPKSLSYVLCLLWERYSAWSHGQLPPVFNRSRWNSLWKKTEYSNAKLKRLLGWTPAISTEEGLRRYFAACRAEKARA